jgi:hypothetical protein
MTKRCVALTATMQCECMVTGRAGFTETQRPWSQSYDFKIYNYNASAVEG